MSKGNGHGHDGAWENLEEDVRSYMSQDYRHPGSKDKPEPLPDPRENEQFRIAWDAVAKKNERLTQHINGNPCDPEPSLAQIVAAFFEAGNEPGKELPIIPRQIADVILFCAGPLARNSKLRDDVDKLWGTLSKEWTDYVEKNKQARTESTPGIAVAFGPDAAIAPSEQSTVVRGLFHKGSLTLIYGPPKSGKSFLATSMALAVADPSISHWMGQRIQQHGPVLYVACEGHGGFWKRLQAADHVPADFALATGRPALIRNEDGRGYSWVPNPADVQTAIAAVVSHYGRPPVLVIIDTVFRSFGGGNVNDSSHMNAYVAAAQEIADSGCAIGLVHHSTKAGNSPAGSVALMGASDTLVFVEKTENSARTWTIEEAKDDASGGSHGFELNVVDGILDASGDTVSSCVLVPVDGNVPRPSKTAARGRPASDDKTRLARSILADLLVTEGQHGYAPAELLAVQEKRWRAEFYSRACVDDDKQDTKKKSFQRTADKMLNVQDIAINNGWVWLTHPEVVG